jgi:hypothetical protein
MMGGRTTEGQCYVKGHIFKMGLTDSLIYERCLEKEKQPHTSYPSVRT